MNRPLVRAAICLIWRDGRVLVARRKPGAFLGGMSEFPGGKVEHCETAAECAVREAKEEVGLDATLTGRWPDLVHDYPDRRVVLHPFDAACPEGEAKGEVAWRRPQDLDDGDFPPATVPLLRALRSGQRPAPLEADSGGAPGLDGAAGR